MDKLYKTQLIDIVSEKAYLSREDSKAAINAFIEEIETALLAGVEVNITNFGSLVPIIKQETVGTNPRTHEKIVIKARKSVSFRPAISFKEKMAK
ncbi:MAG: HU family DNA-binding protein [Erysipelotrichaceae bacterium]|nr:HU family DNA-binding protein [Erysipelotrichaceae bacterium]